MIILGIILVIGGAACLFSSTIIVTYGVMYFLMVLLFVVGLMLIIKSIANKKFGLDFFFGILSLIVGAFIIFTPNLAFMTETLLLYIMACWMIVRGIIGIVDAFMVRKTIGGGLFALALIVSILVLCAGILSFFHPIIFAGIIGVLICCYFIVEGVDLIIAGCIGRDIEKNIKE